MGKVINIEEIKARKVKRKLDENNMEMEDLLICMNPKQFCHIINTMLKENKPVTDVLTENLNSFLVGYINEQEGVIEILEPCETLK